MDAENFSLTLDDGAPSLDRLTVMSLRDQVHQALRAAILKGRFRTLQRLNERQLAEMLGVSTTPVKEALRQLEADGLVEVHARRGVTVLFDRPWAEEMVLARAALESMIARVAAQRITPEAAQALRTLIEEMRETTRDGSAEDLVRLNARFHGRIHDIADGRYLRRLIERQRVYDAETRKVIHANPRERERAFAEHARVGLAIIDGDVATAEAAMRDHVVRSGEIYLDQVFGRPAED
ncbi:GntR family transcriptional regulator [Frigidibacter sp. MR17.24]|uniref:GntR family transcriptional regulator n=1 Tax=Frigidibacter sp. MR17.24 TaxID=3127345 RepID=UPI003012FE63